MKTFEETTVNVQRVYLTGINDYKIYKMAESIADSIARKVRKCFIIDIEKLANSCTVAAIVRAAVREEFNTIKYGRVLTKQERKDACWLFANYIADLASSK